MGGKEEEVEFGNICFKENENLKPKEREALARKLSLPMTLESFSPSLLSGTHTHAHAHSSPGRIPPLPSGDRPAFRRRSGDTVAQAEGWVGDGAEEGTGSHGRPSVRPPPERRRGAEALVLT